MRTTRRLGWGLAGMLGLAAAASGQVPAVPVVPVAPVAAPLGAAAVPVAAPAAAPKNIWSFFCKTPEQKAQCKAQFCSSSIGQFINNLLLPASAFTGGLIGPCCPNPATTPNAADLAKPATSAQGAAAKIKAEEAQAKAKVAAIAYLASVDCRYYPEAEAGMITGLRAEKNECVRLAAAKALASGCCCTPKVVKALAMSVSCTNRDGFPAEASELVRTYAYVALERCMQKCVVGDAEAPPELPPPVKQALFEALRPTGSDLDLTREILLAGYFAPAVPETPAKVYAFARQVLGKGLKLSPNTLARLSGPRNVYDSVTPNGPQLRLPPGTVVMDGGQATTVPAPMTEPGLMPAVEPPVARHREAAAPRGGPAWLSQAPSSQVVEEQAPPAPPRSGRGNLMSIFQDAAKRQ